MSFWRKICCLFGKHEYIEATLAGRLGDYPVRACRNCARWSSLSAEDRQ
jgi:hypothetical protein